MDNKTEEEGQEKRGRPESYDPAFVDQARKLCKLGATDDELADFFEVSTRTIYRWKNTHEDFCQALKIGKDLADNRVERSLYNKAVGFYFTEQQAIKVKKGQYLEEVKVVDVEKYTAPDTTAMIYWTKNRKKQEWRDRVEHTGEDGAPLNSGFNLSGLSKEDLNDLVGILAKAG